jgi:GNAT superfamily N-acetyltransferase
MSLTVESAADASSVLKAAGGFLSSRPIEHNLVLTLLHERAAHAVPGRYWIARDGTEVRGVVFQSPLDFPATVTPMEAAVAQAIAEAASADGVELPGVNGEAATAAAFAGHWTELTSSGAEPVSGQRLYHLGELRLSEGVPGRLRQATQDDADVVIAYVAGFLEFIGETGPPPDVIYRRLELGQGWLWDDGGPVSLALHSLPVEGVSRIQTVYTPERLRRRGYAGALVGQLSDRLRRAGHECVLYTDLGNPTSNSVYRRLGYEAVVESLRYLFSGRPTP